MKSTRIPRKLYKFRSFGVNSLRLLSEAEIYYANPRSFNDPLDGDPTIHLDTDLASLEKVCFRILIAAHGKEKARLEMINDRYMSTEFGDYKTDKNVENYYMQLLGTQIKTLLDAEMAEWGVLSLAARWDCPLMWSHYSDGHRGFCVEYDMNDHACLNLKPVNYALNRSIKISDLIDWKVHKSAAAEQSVLDTYLFAKSPQWRYEREWRDIHSTNGAKASPFQITGVYFGLRCDRSVRTSVVKLLSHSCPKIKFYDMYPLENSFRLRRQVIDCGEIETIGVKTSIHFVFRDIFLDESKTT